MKRLAIALALVLIIAACGGSNPASEPESDEAPAPTAGATQDTQAPADDPEPEEEPAEEPPEESAEEPAPGGDIAITLTIGDETWEFPGSLCAFYNAPAGDAGSEWNVSYTQDGLQVYAAADSFGKLLSVADIENGGNPTVSWEAAHDEVDITVDGNDISATGTFTDNVNGGTIEGTFEAHCNDWFDATG